MTLYPEAQAKAQAEIDAIVGSSILPTFADRQHLPYVAALISEVFRWMPVTPLGRSLNTQAYIVTCISINIYDY